VPRGRYLLVPFALCLVLGLAGNAQAYRKATRAERRAMARDPQLPTDHGRRLGWAEVSTAGPYAVAWLAGPPNSDFQGDVVLTRRHGRRWGTYVALVVRYRREGLVLGDWCFGVPRAVLLDFRHFFAAQKRKFITPGRPGYSRCAGKIAYAK